ncbi:MAG: hypothetical protein R6U94_03995 [Nitriliruptoraceae bacterium]
MAAELVGQRPAEAEGGSNDDAPLVTAEALPTLTAAGIRAAAAYGAELARDEDPALSAS